MLFYGVRQGAVLSPLFSNYIDDLINRLETSFLGCSINGMYLGCLLYADDIIILSQSITAMQRVRWDLYMVRSLVIWT